MLPFSAGREASSCGGAPPYVRHRPERQGLLERGAENSYLAGDVLEAGPMEQLLGSSMMCKDARMSRAQDAQ